MHPTALHWFRRKQRALSRVMLAAFCLTWLQFAAIPCVMALDSAPSVTSMPNGMVMAPGEHCPYCPPPQPEQGVDEAVCSFPHDPQVDSRVGFAAVLLAPPPTLVLFVVGDATRSAADFVAAMPPPPTPGVSLAVSYCRFLK